MAPTTEELEMLADDLVAAATIQCRHAVERGRRSGLADHQIHRRQREEWGQIAQSFVHLMEAIYCRAMTAALEDDRDWDRDREPPC
jgi:hypothetical protein